MEPVFEEIVSRGLGRLYSAALFMCGGEVSRAEDALVDAIGRAATEYPGPFLEDVTGWLDERVVLYCVEVEGQRWSPQTRAAPTSRSPSISAPAQGASPFRAASSDLLYRAAAELPPRARAALWWIVFQRRRYTDVAMRLGASRDELHALLAHRDVFIAALRRSGRGSWDIALPGK